MAGSIDLKSVASRGNQAYCHKMINPQFAATECRLGQHLPLRESLKSSCSLLIG